MPSKLSRYDPPYEPRSSLLKNPPELSSPIPSIEELELLLPDLKKLRAAAEERSRKASHDLRAIHDSMRKLKEKEKGKAKAVEKVKRERDFTPIPSDESRLPHYPGSKPRMGSSIPPSARSSVDPRRSALEDKKLLKKRKHGEVDPGESDSNQTQRARKGSPAVTSHPSASSSHKVHPKPSIPLSIPHSKATAGPDFSVPPTTNLLPARPPIPSPPIPGPSKPIEVTSDFSKLKQPPQTQVSTFYSSVEPYLRPVREEDVGFLEYTGDEVEPFIMPKLGVHYLEVWEEQDANGYTGIIPKAKEAPASAFVAPKPTWDPSTLTDQDMSSEDKGHGPLTERVISALLPIPDLGWKGVKAAEDAMEGRPGGSGAAAARRERLNVSDLESRIRDTMRYHGLLETVPDFSEKVDDPIATALRHAQQELRTVVATNKARKERLAAIARDRLGYQEYLETREMLDKAITGTYSRLQKKDAPKIKKSHKKKLAGAAAASAAAAAANAEAENPTGVPAAVGMNPDEDNHLLVDEKLREYVETRRKWVDEVGSVFDELQREKPGRVWGFPTESVYEGVEEEVREKLSQEATSSGLPVPSAKPLRNGGGKSLGRANGVHADEKGKGRASDDAMDIG